MLDAIVVVFIRFSYVGRCDWNRWRTKGDYSRAIEDITAELYAHERLDRRFRSFETLTLPSLRQQTNKNFVTIVLTSPQMPPAMLIRLKKLCATLEGAEVLVSEAGSVSEALAVPLDAFETVSNHVVQVRLDDDDALSVNFMERLHVHLKKMRRYKTYAISLSRGLFALNWDNRPISYHLCLRRFIGVGVAARMPAKQSIFSYNHGALQNHFVALTDPSQVNYICQRWSGSDNDKGPEKSSPQEPKIDANQYEKIVRREFPFLVGVDLTQLRT